MNTRANAIVDWCRTRFYYLDLKPGDLVEVGSKYCVYICVADDIDRFLFLESNHINDDPVGYQRPCRVLQRAQECL